MLFTTAHASPVTGSRHRQQARVALSVLVFSLGVAACGSESTSSAISDSYGFVVTGVTGNKVMLDRTWYQECLATDIGVWSKSMRTLSGHELATTVSEYQNGSETADCETGLASITVYVQTLTVDNKMIPITWTDGAGTPTDPPKGLEDVKEGNGATGVVSFATITPATEAKALQLADAQFCGVDDWTAGTTVDLLPCFGTDPAKGTIIVDDRTATGAVYDGISLDPSEYPTMMMNAPHQGPLNGIRF